MDLDSPDKFSVDKISHEKEGGEGNGVDLNDQNHESSVLDATVRGEKLESPYSKSSSQDQYELYNDNERTENADFNRESAHSYQGGETGVARRRYSDDSSSPVEAANFHSEVGIEDPAGFKEDFSYQPEDIKENSPHHEVLRQSFDRFSENSQQDKSESAYEVMEHEGSVHLMEKDYGGNETLVEEKYYSGKSLSNNGEIEGRDADVHSLGRIPQRSASPGIETTVSPERSPNLRGKLSSSPQGRHNSVYSPRSSRRKILHSPERTGGDSGRVPPEGHASPYARHVSSSPSRRSRREPPRKDDSLRKRLSTSPRRRPLSPDRRRPERSVSRSPTRQRDSSYGSRREYRDRSRSRSPHARDHSRRSPRRYSPMRRSSPGYHSRRRSPRKRPWSPPRNRNNGVGRPGNNLFVAGFSFVTTERDLERKFSRFGRVRDVRIVRDKRSGDSRGFGFLSLERDEDADEAIQALDQTEWNGRVVLVEKSKSR